MSCSSSFTFSSSLCQGFAIHHRPNVDGKLAAGCDKWLECIGIGRGRLDATVCAHRRGVFDVAEKLRQRFEALEIVNWQERVDERQRRSNALGKRLVSRRAQ